MKYNSMKRDSEKYPRKTRFSLSCQCLDNDGMKCKKRATTEAYVFLDNELYDYGKRWMIVFTCNDHAPKP